MVARMVRAKVNGRMKNTRERMSPVMIKIIIMVITVKLILQVKVKRVMERTKLRARKTKARFNVFAVTSGVTMLRNVKAKGRRSKTMKHIMPGTLILTLMVFYSW
jgi:hypothetical protein